MDTTFRIGESWSLAMGRQDGLPMIVRKNAWCDQIAPSPLFPLRCGISINFRKASPNGLPAPTEQSILDMLEERLIDLFHSPAAGILAAVITTNGFREYVLFAQSREAFIQYFALLQQDFPAHPLASYIEPDEAWEGYFAF